MFDGILVPSLLSAYSEHVVKIGMVVIVLVTLFQLCSVSHFKFFFYFSLINCLCLGIVKLSFRWSDV